MLPVHFFEFSVTYENAALTSLSTCGRLCLSTIYRQLGGVEMTDYKLPSTDTIFKAKIIDVAPEGRLIMESDSGNIMKFAFKEVVFVNS